MSDLTESLLPHSFLFQVVGLNIQVNPHHWRDTTLELTFFNSQDSSIKRLLFRNQQQLRITESFPATGATVEILDISSRGWENAKTEVLCGDGQVFWFCADSVELADKIT